MPEMDGKDDEVTIGYNWLVELKWFIL